MRLMTKKFIPLRRYTAIFAMLRHKKKTLHLRVFAVTFLPLFTEGPSAKKQKPV